MKMHNRMVLVTVLCCYLSISAIAQQNGVAAGGNDQKGIRTGHTTGTDEYYASPYLLHGTKAFYPGGDSCFVGFVKTHMQLTGELKICDKDSPNLVTETFINFEIEKDGKISDVNCAGRVDLDTEIDLAPAVKMSVWKPYINEGNLWLAVMACPFIWKVKLPKPAQSNSHLRG